MPAVVRREIRRTTARTAGKPKPATGFGRMLSKLAGASAKLDRSRRRAKR